MKRRRLVALISACVLLALGLVAVIAGLVVTRTDYGREQVRKVVQQQLKGAFLGRIYIGRISGGFLTGITIDSVAIRDVDDDSMFVSTGRVTLSYDPRDIIDKRIWIRHIDVEHPAVYLRQHENGRWNFKEIFKSYDERAKGPKAPGRSFGDFVVIDSARVTGAHFVLQMPWHPDDTLRGAKRDSAVRYTLSRPDKEIRQIIDDGKRSYARTWRWTNVRAFASHMRIADPDSDKVGRFFAIDSLDVKESDPPFVFRNVVAAKARNLGDSIWVDVPHFDLPGSTGSGKGKLWWGNDLPLRVDIAVRGDSVSLNDVNWVYPTLPTTGGGSVNLTIRNERDLRVIDYKLADMDVRSTGSLVRGNMTFGVGGPVLVVKDVRLDASPLDFDFLRTLNGKPFPVDWRGQLYGAVRGRGGPVNHFVVDDAQVRWRDTHVRGAESHFGGKGELDILVPAVTAFHDFHANVQSLDLRSIEYLFPSFPHLRGTIAGTATLDSSWLDLRFANADILHRDGPGDPSHLIGDGRVTWGARYMTYDVDLDAQPLSLSMLARSYPKLRLNGLVSGPIQAKGTIANLQLAAALQGASGAFSFSGIVDIDTPTVAARGTGQFSALNVAQLISGSGAIATRLNGAYQVDVAGDSLANLRGSVGLHVDRSVVDSVRVFPSVARLHFADRRMFVDSLRVETAAATATATGALGLPQGASDSLHFQVEVDSLGGLRRYLAGATAPAAATNGAAPVYADSLSGSLAITGWAKGRLDSLDVAGRLTGTNAYLRIAGAHGVDGAFFVRNILANPVGVVTARLDTLRLPGVALDTLGATVNVDSRSVAQFRVGAVSHSGPSLDVSGDIHRGAGDALLVAIRKGSAVVDKSSWQLARPALLNFDSAGATLDTLALRSSTGGFISARATVPAVDQMRIDFHADSVALADVGAIAQMPTLSGRAGLDVHIGGTRASPHLALSGGIAELRMGGMHIERVIANGGYSGRRFDGALSVLRGGTPALNATASLPLDLSEFHVRQVDDSLRGSIRADSADFAIAEAFFSGITNASGRLTSNLEIGGTWKHPTVGGDIRLADAAATLPNAGITLSGIQGDVGFIPGQDSMVIRRLNAWSGSTPAQSIALSGFISFSKFEDPLLGLRLDAHRFHALDKKTLARLDLSTGANGLQLVGRTNSATLSGTIRVDRGLLFLPDRDLAQKQIVDLSGQEAYSVVDTSDVRSRSLLPDAWPALVANLRLDGVHIELGDDVWLRSHEADIKLGGSLNVTRAPDESRLARTTFGGRHTDTPSYRLALEGTLDAQRGTYTLDLLAVQREFAVQHGTITFTGAADNNPILDISALYNVKRPKERDLGVIVRVHGPLFPNPVLDFGSTESYEISQTDLISYLITGLPSFQIQDALSRTAAQVLLPTASTVLARSLRTQLGSWVDLVQFGAADPTSTGAQNSATNAARDFLLGARLGGETQVGRNLFFSFSAGLCPLAAQNQQVSIADLAGTVGGKLEYRVSSDLSLQAAREPPSRLLYCGGNQQIRTLVPTPPQWGLSLLRTWRF